MARPKTRTELLTQSQANFDRLLALVEEASPSQRTTDFPPGTLNRNVRDVFAHLHHWHTLFLSWYEQGKQGKKPQIPAPGYTWKTTPALNQAIQLQHAHTPLEEVQAQLVNSHQQIQQLIERHTEEELFTKKRYKWTGSTSLGAYLISATSSHYDWGYKLIRKAWKSAA